MKELKKDSKEWKKFLEDIKTLNTYEWNIKYNSGRHNYITILRLENGKYTFGETKYVYKSLKNCRIAIAKLYY